VTRLAAPGPALAVRGRADRKAAIKAAAQKTGYFIFPTGASQSLPLGWDLLIRSDDVNVNNLTRNLTHGRSR